MRSSHGRPGPAARSMAARRLGPRVGVRGFRTPGDLKRLRPVVVPVVALLFAECASAPPAPSPGAPEPSRAELAYGLPAAPSASYTLGDTVTITFEGAGLTNLRVEGAYYAALDFAFARAEDGVEVTARATDFAGQLRNPMAGTTSASEADIDGAWVARLSPRGRVRLLSAPRLACDFTDVVGTENLLRGVFPLLPPRPVAVGDSWTDTLRVDEARSSRHEEGCPAGAGRERSTTVVQSTFVGDTLVGERTLRLIRSVHTTEMELQSESDGTRVVQVLSGETRSTALWDTERRLLVRATEEGTLAGTLDVESAGMEKVPLRARVRRSVQLQGS